MGNVRVIDLLSSERSFQTFFKLVVLYGYFNCRITRSVENMRDHLTKFLKDNAKVHLLTQLKASHLLFSTGLFSNKRVHKITLLSDKPLPARIEFKNYLYLNRLALLTASASHLNRFVLSLSREPATGNYGNYK